jgi:molecular chaperone DnaK
VTEAEARNRADNLIYQTEKLLKENREKLAEADAKAVESAIEDCRRAIADGNVERINATVEELTKASHRIAEALYKTQNASGGAAPGGPGGPESSHTGSTDGAGGQAGQGQGDVVDAEFVDVDESKKPN